MRAVCKADLGASAFDEMKIGNLTLVEGVDCDFIEMQWIAIVDAAVLPGSRPPYTVENICALVYSLTENDRSSPGRDNFRPEPLSRRPFSSKACAVIRSASADGQSGASQGSLNDAVQPPSASIRISRARNTYPAGRARLGDPAEFELLVFGENNGIVGHISFDVDQHSNSPCGKPLANRWPALFRLTISACMLFQGHKPADW
jgi:hypothetical protein